MEERELIVVLVMNGELKEAYYCCSQSRKYVFYFVILKDVWMLFKLGRSL